ncbi:DUF4180 domain-containing protein [Streptomyces sp. NPDC052179]|uniref:DUF4180 domain-containing protein n=1 Tax=Streptomyces sp. NPDC052179 TaxID=3155680 RepID=UPI00342E01A1
MPDLFVEHHGVPVLVHGADGAPIATVQDALDCLVGAAFQGAEVVAVPADCFDDRFFDLSTGFAGEVFQKFANYRLRLAIVGDISRHLRGGSALPALIREADRGRHVWFVADLDDLAARLKP